MSDEVVDQVVGPEWDSELLARLRAVVEALGGTMSASDWGLGGSQEISEYAIRIGEASVTATAETYVGLRLCGPASLVAQLNKELSLDERDDA